MTELLYALGLIFIILLSTWAVLKFGNIKGLRSHRGATVFLLLVLSWGISWLAAMVFLPLGIVAALLVQILTLVLVAKLPVVKAVIVSTVYTLVTVLLVLVLSMLTIGQQFS